MLRRFEAHVETGVRGTRELVEAALAAERVLRGHAALRWFSEKFAFHYDDCLTNVSRVRFQFLLQVYTNFYTNSNLFLRDRYVSPEAFDLTKSYSSL